MTNKMPVVGQRYRYKTAKDGKGFLTGLFKSEGIFTFDTGSILRFAPEHFWNMFEELAGDNLQETEEVKVNKTPNPVDLEKEEVNEIERASNLLRLAIGSAEARAMVGETGIVEKVLSRAKSLIDALEVEKAGMNLVKDALKDGVKQMEEFNQRMDEQYPMSKPEPKIDMKEERVEPVSIWKDVSELPEKFFEDVLIKNENNEIYCQNLFGEYVENARNGDYSDYSRKFVENSKYCTLKTAQIILDYFEQMQKDIEELKRK